MEQAISRIVTRPHLRRSVRVAIDLDNDFSAVLDKIENVAAKRDLSAEVKAFPIKISQRLPKCSFGRRGISAKLTRAIFHFVIELVSHPPTLTLHNCNFPVRTLRHRYKLRSICCRNGLYLSPAFSPTTRPFNSAIILLRSSPLTLAHRAISSSERPQPWQRPLAGSITQTLMQGVSITDRWGVC